jgi:hypothetical protein
MTLLIDVKEPKEKIIWVKRLELARGWFQIINATKIYYTTVLLGTFCGNLKFKATSRGYI